MFRLNMLSMLPTYVKTVECHKLALYKISAFQRSMVYFGCTFFYQIFLKFQVDAPPPSPPPETAYNERVVAFLRQPSIMEVLKEKTAAIVNHKSLRDKVNAIRQDGTTALDRLSCDVELTMLLRYVLYAAYAYPVCYSYINECAIHTVFFSLQPF